MNPELKQPVSLPPINWDKVLKWSAITAISITAISLVSRARTFIVIAQFIDLIIVINLVCLAAYALVAKSAQKNAQSSQNPMKPSNQS